MPRKERPRPIRPRYKFTKADCVKGFQRAVEACMASAKKLAWLYRRVKKSYRKGDRHDP